MTVYLRIIVALILCLSFPVSYSQEKLEEPTFKKNAFYGNLGGGWMDGIYFSATAYAERTLWSKEKKWQIDRKSGTVEQKGRIANFLRVGFGGYGIWFESISGKYLLLQTGFLFGASKSHFEAAFGAGYFFGDSEFRSFLPTGSIGYRFQEPVFPSL